MKKITILIALFIGVMIGCQNSDLELAPTENLRSNDQLLPLRETFDFTYNGKTYSSPFYMENDTLMILEDEEVAAIHNRLQELPDLATYVTPNGDIEYYDSYEELELNKQSKGLKNKNATIGLYYYTVMIYEHADFNTKRMGISRALNAPLAIPDLDAAEAMDDMISSFTAGSQNTTYISGTHGITFFRNPNYKAQSITFTFTGKDRVMDQYSYCYYCKVRDFHDYKVKKGINWNDRISSMKTFVQ